MQILSYGAFYDFPHQLIVNAEGVIVSLDSEFSDTIDDYEDFFRVHILPSATMDDFLTGAIRLREAEKVSLGTLPVKEVTFDYTRRMSIKSPELQTMVAEYSPREDAEYPKLIFPLISEEEMDYFLWEINMKEWCGAAVVETEDGTIFPVTFYTSHRCAQNVEQVGILADPGLIIIQDMTLETMQSAIRTAWRQGYFETLRPLNAIEDNPEEDE